VIHRLRSEEPVAPPAQDIAQPSDALHYYNAIVKKPWGYEYLAFENEHVAIWILHIIRKRKTSMHCHPRKRLAYSCCQELPRFTISMEASSYRHWMAWYIEKGTYHLRKRPATFRLTLFQKTEYGSWR